MTSDPQTKDRIENVVNVVKRDFLDGRLYYGCDELNMSCLAWLDGDGNGQINERTGKIPRDMFRNEYLKLQHVYLDVIQDARREILSLVHSEEQRLPFFVFEGPAVIAEGEGIAFGDIEPAG